MERKIRIAVIGVGKWGKNLLKEASALADVTWAVHGGSPETEQFLKENYPAVKSTSNLKEVLDDPGVEAVIIATPIETHRYIASQALKSGKHVFLEKPAGKTTAELEELVILAKEKNLQLAVGYEFPHHPAAKKIKELLSETEELDTELRIIYFKNSWELYED